MKSSRSACGATIAATALMRPLDASGIKLRDAALETVTEGEGFTL